MNKQVVSNVDTAMLTSGVIVGLAQIQQIIGIVLVSIQLAWILGKFICKIYDNVKHRKYGALEQEVHSVVEGLNKLQEQVNGVKNG